MRLLSSKGQFVPAVRLPPGLSDQLRRLCNTRDGEHYRAGHFSLMQRKLRSYTASGSLINPACVGVPKVLILVAGGEGCNAAAVQEADGACGSGGRGARRGSASLLCRDAAFHVAEQLAEATAPAAEDTAQAARGNAQAPREAGHADNGVMQGQEPGGVSSSAESGPAGAAAPAASAGGGPRCQVCLAHQVVSL